MNYFNVGKIVNRVYKVNRTLVCDRFLTEERLKRAELALFDDKDQFVRSSDHHKSAWHKNFDIIKFKTCTISNAIGRVG